jgi:hypothetical protein
MALPIRAARGGDVMSGFLRASVILSLALCVLGAGTALAVGRQDDAPSGGGMGCKSRGTCNGTLYRNKLNLDSWWYDICSGCHVVQAPRPSDATTKLTRFQQDLVSNQAAFWRFHADAEPDPVLRRLTPKAHLLATNRVRAPYRALLVR